MDTPDPITPDPDDLPSEPYNGTSGWSGSETSERRAPIRSQAQRGVLTVVTSRGTLGATQQELSALLSKGHGTISGALSNLHRAGHLERLRVERNGQQVYVAPKFVAERETVPFRPNAGRRRLVSFADQVVADCDAVMSMLSHGNLSDARDVVERMAVNADRIRQDASRP